MATVFLSQVNTQFTAEHVLCEKLAEGVKLLGVYGKYLNSLTYSKPSLEHDDSRQK